LAAVVVAVKLVKVKALLEQVAAVAVALVVVLVTGGFLQLLLALLVRVELVEQPIALTALMVELQFMEL
jgi:hypothetical protein